MSRSEKSQKTIAVIGLFKLLKGLILVAAGIGAVSLLHKDVATTVTNWLDSLRVDPDNGLIHKLLSQVFAVTPKQLKEISAGTFFYAALLLTEGTGLLLRKRWAEYFTAITTALLIPLEIYQLVKRFTLMRVDVLVVNVGDRGLSDLADS
jgi:uncharacterized membrane protein (DUF2068 family)